ncbi:uncharacterized protein I206_105845 [Kwoniella pini CBS 10737]|uniref:Palmitoyltransferase n=1 Tax=Kwoniella pini CBS 10737 TaxID=1296096 RepID=A0A1B9I0I1_9TREE|nr:uncharacterized protein I206_04665 [Kwoniella pini CBS 10737]OCF48978.1 hypothetical protein I206_04665 [Kwoniella pini CBS 10737]
MANLVIRLLQQLIPPLLLSYFYFAWKIATFEVGPNLISNSTSGPIIGYLYVILPSLLIVPTTLSFLRLYFLPSVQSVPPLDPPLLIQDKKIIFECLSPAEAKIIRLANDEEHDDDEPLVERCYKGECGGRWKPARTRHCNTCERCRGGWDHHCPIFANCLTAPYMRSFLALLLYTLPTVTIISLPLYKPLWTRCREAYTLSWTNEYIRQNWWEWRYSWIVAGGPIGRYAGGTFLGWKELDKIDEDSILRLNVGLMVLLGIILALISAGLAYTTISLLIKGNLTIDRGRSTAHNQALMAIRRLQLQNQSIPAKLEANLAKFSDQRYFFVPLPLTEGQLGRKGKIVETLPHERPYDHGLKKNLHIVLGRGWKWILPWNALRRGMDDEVFMWPIQDGVERRLREEAQRRFQEGDESR